MIAAMMEIDGYWRTRTIAEALGNYAFLRLTCNCGRITDYPFPLLLQRKRLQQETKIEAAEGDFLKVYCCGPDRFTVRTAARNTLL